MKRVKHVIAEQELRETDPGENVGVALAKMESWGVSALAVVDKHRNFLGIVTMANVAHAKFGQDGETVGDSMTPTSKIVFAEPNDTLRHCGAIMNEKHFHHMPVIEEEQVVGMISALDLQMGLEEEREEATDIARDMPQS